MIALKYIKNIFFAGIVCKGGLPLTEISVEQLIFQTNKIIECVFVNKYG